MHGGGVKGQYAEGEKSVVAGGRQSLNLIWRLSRHNAASCKSLSSLLYVLTQLRGST